MNVEGGSMIVGVGYSSIWTPWIVDFVILQTYVHGPNHLSAQITPWFTDTVKQSGSLSTSTV